MQSIVKIAILFSILFSFGCSKEDPEPAPPVITFLDAQLSSDKSYGIVRFEFFDSDGDLGLKQDENSGEQEHNVLIDYYEKRNGIWELKSPIITFNVQNQAYDTGDLNLRFPFLENEGQSTLEGEITLDLQYDFNVDTFRYDIRIKDRAFQTSNMISTTELIVN